MVFEITIDGKSKILEAESPGKALTSIIESGFLPDMYAKVELVIQLTKRERATILGNNLVDSSRLGAP